MYSLGWPNTMAEASSAAPTRELTEFRLQSRAQALAKVPCIAIAEAVGIICSTVTDI